MRFGEESAQVLITHSVLHKHGQIVSVLHVQLRAYDRSHLVLPSSDRKTLGAIKSMTIEQRDRRHVELGGRFRQVFWKGCAAKKTKGAGGMQFDVGHGNR